MRTSRYRPRQQVPLCRHGSGWCYRKLFQAAEPCVEVRTSRADLLQPDQLRHLRPYCRLQFLVRRELGDDPLRWRRVLPIVDQLRRLSAIGYALQYLYSTTRIIEELGQFRGVSKQIGFKLVQLDKRKEPTIVSLFLPRRFQVGHLIVRSAQKAVRFLPSRKVLMKSIKINHRREEHVVTSILLEVPLYVVLHGRSNVVASRFRSTTTMSRGSNASTNVLDWVLMRTCTFSLTAWNKEATIWSA